MSFKSILSGIVNVGTKILGVEQALAPALQFIPGVGQAITIYGGAAARFLHAIGAMEHASPVGGGQAKADGVVADFEAGLEILAAYAATQGKSVSYDDSLMREAVSDTVSGLNKFAKVKASIELIDTPKPTG